jgi:hypothetical protein
MIDSVGQSTTQNTVSKMRTYRDQKC